MTTNLNFRENEIYQDCDFNGGHDYESINSQYISTNVIEIEYICLDCGSLKYVYNYLEDDI